MIHIVGGILVRDGKVLLGKRSPAKRICPEMWDVAGGHVEGGESREETLARELDEEIGVTPTVQSFLATLSFFDGGNPVALHIHRVDAWTGEPRLMNDEHTALRWFTIEEAVALPDLAAEEYRALFRAL